MILDLSVPVGPHTVTYPTDPPVSVLRTAHVEDCGYNVSELKMGTHSGTHADLPLHCIARGMDAASAPLDLFVGAATAVDVPIEAGGAVSLKGAELGCVRAGDILIVRTGWERFAGSPMFFEKFPHFSPEAAEVLLGLGIKAVGTDMPSADAPGGSGAVHQAILSNGIAIIEALVNLETLVGKRFFFSAAPLKIEQGDGSPVRAYAILEENDGSERHG